MAKLKAGTLKDFPDSMAAAIEDAFKKEWDTLQKGPLPEIGRADRRLLFVAIAQGVINHLQERAAESFAVKTVNVTQDSPLITSSGYVSINNAAASFNIDEYGTGSVTITNVPVTVTQDGTDANKIKSSGTGNQVEIEVEAE